MNDHSGNDHEVRLMRELVTELRAERPPPVDWERVERGLSVRVEEEAALRRRRAARWQDGALARAAGYAAVAAGIALLVTAPSPTLPSPAVAEAPLRVVDVRQVPARAGADAAPTYQVGALRPGSVITAEHRPVRFALEGVATWTLGPASRAIVRTVDVPHVIRLEQGALHAEVVPRTDDASPMESFIVEAAGTRVAVHGTVFSVERHAYELTVEVTRGAVTVGPAAHRGLTTGHLLVAPARAAFSLDGGRQARLLPPDRHWAAWPLPGQRGRTGERGRSAPLPADAMGMGPDDIALDPLAAADGDLSAADMAAPKGGAHDAAGPGADSAAADAAALGPSRFPAITLGQAQAAMVSCLGAPATPSTGPEPVRVTISSTVRLGLDDERRIVSVQFVPPLKPELQQRCASTVFGRRLAGSAESAEFAVVFRPR